MKKQELLDVKKYLLECLRHKYGTYVEKCGENKLELLNDDDIDILIITLEWHHKLDLS